MMLKASNPALFERVKNRVSYIQNYAILPPLLALSVTSIPFEKRHLDT